MFRCVVSCRRTGDDSRNSACVGPADDQVIEPVDINSGRTARDISVAGCGGSVFVLSPCYQAFEFGVVRYAVALVSGIPQPMERQPGAFGGGQVKDQPLSDPPYGGVRAATAIRLGNELRQPSRRPAREIRNEGCR